MMPSIIQFVPVRRRHSIGTSVHKGRMFLVESSYARVTKVHGPFLHWHSAPHDEPAPLKGQGIVVETVGTAKHYHYFKKTNWIKAFFVKHMLNKSMHYQADVGRD